MYHLYGRLLNMHSCSISESKWWMTYFCNYFVTGETNLELVSSCHDFASNNPVNKINRWLDKNVFLYGDLILIILSDSMWYLCCNLCKWAIPITTEKWWYPVSKYSSKWWHVYGFSYLKSFFWFYTFLQFFTVCGLLVNFEKKIHYSNCYSSLFLENIFGLIVSS